jgi:uncharacterized protein
MTVIHEEARHRFVIDADGSEAELRYARPDEHTIDLQHTAVPVSARGHHVGDALARAAFAYARASGLRVIPTCPFIRGWLARHPEESDIVIQDG